MSTSDDIRIERMQSNLSTIRKVARMTSEQFGEAIGVSRQTIGNIENGRSKLTKTQYLAIRAVLNYMAADNQGLAQIVRALVDEPVEEDDSLEYCEVRPTLSAMDDMSKTTEVLAGGASYAALVSLVKAAGGSKTLTKSAGGTSAISGALVAGAVLPAFAYALYKKLKS